MINFPPEFAFPQPHLATKNADGSDYILQGQEGMTLRDYFAARSLAAAEANFDGWSVDYAAAYIGIPTDAWADDALGNALKCVAKLAYAQADAMLEARKVVAK